MSHNGAQSYLSFARKDKISWICWFHWLVSFTARKRCHPCPSFFYLLYVTYVPPLLLSETEQKSAEVGEIWNRLVIISIVRGLSQKFAKVNFKPSRPLGWSWTRDAPAWALSALFERVRFLIRWDPIRYNFLQKSQIHPWKHISKRCNFKRPDQVHHCFFKFLLLCLQPWSKKKIVLFDAPCIFP